jgi:hypothetical protein
MYKIKFFIMTRSTKQFTIIGIYMILFIGFISIIIVIATPNPSCQDGVQNQKEEEIDCGGPYCMPCKKELVGKDLVVTEAHLVTGGENKYDVVASMYNPNMLYGGEEIYYTVEILDGSGNVLNTRTGQTFILPNENKYIIEVGIDSKQQPSSVSVTVDNVKWIKFTDFDSPQILVKNQRFGLVDGGTNYAEAFGVVSNESPYDFHNVTIHVILEDERGVPVAVNKTQVRTLDADSQREFRLLWPHEFPGVIKTAQMQAETNIFDSLNFMKKYLPGGQYQDMNTEE